MATTATRLLLAVIVITAAAPARAGGTTLRVLEATPSDDTYVVELEVRLTATPVTVRAILSDYKNWPRWRLTWASRP